MCASSHRSGKSIQRKLSRISGKDKSSLYFDYAKTHQRATRIKQALSQLEGVDVLPRSTREQSGIRVGSASAKSIDFASLGGQRHASGPATMIKLPRSRWRLLPRLASQKSVCREMKALGISWVMIACCDTAEGCFSAEVLLLGYFCCGLFAEFFLLGSCCWKFV